jgi:hypothetical protein
MSDTVKIYHPITKATSTVAPISVPAWQRAGWMAAGGDVPPTDSTSDDAEDTPRPKRRGPQIPVDRPDTKDAGASGTITTDKE